MAVFNRNIVQMAQDNTDFRRVVRTEVHSQVALMSIQPGDDIGEETHHVDQVLVFVSGTGEAILNDQTSAVGPNSLVLVPAGTKHNFVNSGSEPLKLYTVYAPPEEPDGLVHKDKAEAEAWEKANHQEAGPTS